MECGLTCGEGVGAYPGYIYAADAELGQPAGQAQLPGQRKHQAGRDTNQTIFTLLSLPIFLQR